MLTPLTPAKRQARKARARAARLEEARNKKEKALRDEKLDVLDREDDSKGFSLKVRRRECIFGSVCTRLCGASERGITSEIVSEEGVAHLLSSTFKLYIQEEMLLLTCTRCTSTCHSSVRKTGFTLQRCMTCGAE